MDKLVLMFHWSWTFLFQHKNRVRFCVGQNHVFRDGLSDGSHSSQVRKCENKFAIFKIKNLK